MFVQDRMSRPAVTIMPKTSFQDAMGLMRERKFRRLPVVNKKGSLVGIVSERDLLHAAPSQVTSLSIWEITYLLSKLKVREIMTQNVITTTPDTPIEDAARLMVDHKIGGLPVMDEENQIAGIITETDIFGTFVEILSGGRPGLRLTLAVPERRDVLLGLCKAIFDQGGGVASVGSFEGVVPGERRLVVKVQSASQDQLVDAIEALGDHVLDVRTV